MIELRIIKVDKFNYFLVDNNNNSYNLKIQFYDIEKKPQVGDYIYINKNMLSSGNVFSFGSIVGEYGKNILDGNKEEIIIIKKGEELICLKRYYG